MRVETISLVMPCFNEEKTIDAFHRRVINLADSLPHKRFEFIYVNDCSSDETGSKLNKLAAEDYRVKVVHLAQNRGQQVALSAGMDLSTGDMIVTIDSDLQDPPELILKMTKKIEKGFDVVHARRKQRKGETVFKILTARIFYRLLQWFANTPIIENCGDFRAFTRPVMETANAFRSNNRFLRGIFVQVGFRQCIIDYDRDARYAGKTKYTFLKMMRLSADALLGFSDMPIRIIMMVSILLWLLSLTFLFKSLVEHFIFNLTVPGWTSLVLLITFFTGLILFSIAIIGSYVGRIFIQGQNPPLYWIGDIRNMELDLLNMPSAELPEIKLSRYILDRKSRDLEN
jgi:glycosyltransferase involved in cell wall biosynthesis